MKSLDPPHTTNNGDGQENVTNIIESSSCSTPFVSAPSSPGRTGGLGLGLFYSAPASPMHFLLSTNNSLLTPPPSCVVTEAAGNEFDFDASCYPMTSADELFFNGQIRPMKDEVSDDHHPCGRLELRNRSLRRVRSEEQIQYDNNDDDDDDINDNDNNDDDDDDDDKLRDKKKSDDVEGRPWLLRNSKRWVSLFLYRSKSEGRNNGRHKYFWSSVVKDKKLEDNTSNKKNKQKEVMVKEDKPKMKAKTKTKTNKSGKSCSNSEGLGLSAHYTAKRAHSEEMRKKTYLPYRQGIFGCIGLNPTPGPPASFNAYAARALNSVSS